MLSKGCSCSYNGDMCPEHTIFCQDYPLSSQTPTPGFMDRGHMKGKMTFRRSKCFAKVVHAMETGVLNIQTPVTIKPLNPFSPGGLILHAIILSCIKPNQEQNTDQSLCLTLLNAQSSFNLITDRQKTFHLVELCLRS